MRPLLCALLLTASVFAESKKGCDLVTEAEASQVLGGPVKKMDLMGACSFGYREKGLTMTVTPMNVGSGVKTVYEGMKSTNKSGGWLAGDEKGMGDMAFAILIKRSAESSAGKAGFVVAKGPNVLQVTVSDRTAGDYAGKQEMLDKLRPLAKKAAGLL